MSYDIQAKQKVRTIASGDVVNFRSMLEARWSLAFDRLHLQWEYEPKTFALRSGRLYTPDFRVVSPDAGEVWVEIKPAMDPLCDVEAKLHEYAQVSLPREGRFFSIAADFPTFCQTGRPTVIEWTEDGVRSVSKAEATEVFCGKPDFRKKYPDLYAQHMARVFEAVRSERFHGPAWLARAIKGVTDTPIDDLTP